MLLPFPIVATSVVAIIFGATPFVTKFLCCCNSGCYYNFRCCNSHSCSFPCCCNYSHCSDSCSCNSPTKFISLVLILLDVPSFESPYIHFPNSPSNLFDCHFICNPPYSFPFPHSLGCKFVATFLQFAKLTSFFPNINMFSLL
jgi:hypothetical protein